MTDTPKEIKEQDANPLGASEVPGYAGAITELKAMLNDAKKNRVEVDPQKTDEKWDGFLEGIAGALYRLEMHTTA